MGERPRCSEIKVFDAETDEIGSIVEIISETREGYGRPDPISTDSAAEEIKEKEWREKNKMSDRETFEVLNQHQHILNLWQKDGGYRYRIDEDGNNRVVGRVMEILTDKEIHPDGCMVSLDTTDNGRVQRILAVEEEELFDAVERDRFRDPLTERQTELLRKYKHKAQYFPKIDIPSPPETDLFEYKSSFSTPIPSWTEYTCHKCGLNTSDDKKPPSKDWELKRSVCNAVAAFANSNGGKVFIGVDDYGNIVKTQIDGKILRGLKPDLEKYEDNFDNFNREIQTRLIRLTQNRVDLVQKIKFQIGEDNEFLVLDVPKWHEAIFIRDLSRGDHKEAYYIRLKGMTHECTPSEQNNHTKRRFSNSGSSNNAGGWNQGGRNYRR
jgi:hypothetical protein